MKFNWGTGIFLFYSFFATALFFQVYLSTQYDNSLVVENYYEKDLSYQQTFNQLKNSQALNEPVILHFFEAWHLVALQFPKDLKKIKGTVLFYRPSDKKQDVTYPILIDGGNCMEIMIQDLSEGKWRIEVDWEAEEKKYLDRFVIDKLVIGDL